MVFQQTIGSRAQVMNGTAEKTSGGLKKKVLKYNSQGGFVAVKNSGHYGLSGYYAERAAKKGLVLFVLLTLLQQ